MATISVDYGHIENGSFRDKVYCPSEDTFFFVDALQLDAEYLLSRNITFALEIGCGSGYISSFLLRLLKEHRRRNGCHGQCSDPQQSAGNSAAQPATAGDTTVPFVLAVDINNFASMATLETARRNAVADKLDAVTMDMFTSLNKQRAQKMVDLIMFNPPYVPSSDDDPGQREIDLAWNGGLRGREVTDRFIESVNVSQLKCTTRTSMNKEYLTQDGAVYLLLEKRNDVQDVMETIAEHGFTPKIIHDRQIIGETLYIVRFTR